MNGIFSSTPAPGPIRLIVGSHGLLLIQSAIAWHLPDAAGLPRLLIAVTCVPAIIAFTLAICGEAQREPRPWWERRDAR